MTSNIYVRKASVAEQRDVLEYLVQGRKMDRRTAEAKLKESQLYIREDRTGELPKKEFVIFWNEEPCRVESFVISMDKALQPN